MRLIYITEWKWVTAQLFHMCFDTIASPPTTSTKAKKKKKRVLNFLAGTRYAHTLAVTSVAIFRITQ